jgi:hypothetical protein
VSDSSVRPSHHGTPRGDVRSARPGVPLWTILGAILVLQAAVVVLGWQHLR